MQFRMPDYYILCIISYYFFFFYNDNNNNNSSFVRFGFGFRFIAENFREEKIQTFYRGSTILRLILMMAISHDPRRSHNCRAPRR